MHLVADQDDASVPLYPVEKAFVLQIRGQSSAVGNDCSGRIEHLASGKTMSFETLDQLLAFLASRISEVALQRDSKLDER